MRLWFLIKRHASPVEALMEKCILRLTLLVSNMLSKGNSACVSYRTGLGKKKIEKVKVLNVVDMST